MISFQSEPGVILSNNMNARMNSTTPMKAKSTAASALWTIDRIGSAISLASHVVTRAEIVIVRSVGARVVAYRSWNVLYLVRSHRRPAAKLGRDDEKQQDHTKGSVN